MSDNVFDDSVRVVVETPKSTASTSSKKQASCNFSGTANFKAISATNGKFSLSCCSCFKSKYICTVVGALLVKA